MIAPAYTMICRKPTTIAFSPMNRIATVISVPINASSE